MSDMIDRGPGEALVLSLERQLRLLVEALRADRPLERACIQALRELFARYLQALDEPAPAQDGPGVAIFEDVPREDLSDADILEQLRQWPDAGIVLSHLGLCKLVPEQDDVLQGVSAQGLLRAGYLMPVAIDTAFGGGHFCALSAKGWQCLHQKRILQQLKKSTALFSLPRGLFATAERWDQALFCRAFLLWQYYQESGGGDYLLFQLPQRESCLLGCRIPGPSGVCYEYPCLSSPDEAEDLRTLLALPQIDAITAIHPFAGDRERIEALSAGLPGREKLKICGSKGADI